MDCRFCGSIMDCVDSDDRLEWRSEQYVCRECHLPHERLTTYQPQSSLVECDELSIDYDTVRKAKDKLWKEQVLPPPEVDGKYVACCPWCGVVYSSNKCHETINTVNKEYEPVENSGYCRHSECGHFVKFVPLPWFKQREGRKELKRFKVTVAADTWDTYEVLAHNDEEAEEKVEKHINDGNGEADDESKGIKLLKIDGGGYSITVEEISED